MWRPWAVSWKACWQVPLRGQAPWGLDPDFDEIARSSNRSQDKFGEALVDGKATITKLLATLGLDL